MTTGRIHSVESFGTQDGPGIRYVVFMQGCPLRCKYCHNPDTWLEEGGREIEVEQLFAKILRCQPYMERSGGGLTVSGGEPTLQSEFVYQLLARCKEAKIHTAIDTCGYVTRDKLEKLLPVVDLVLLDIKHIDNLEHQKLTGVSNQKILEVVRLLEEKEQDYWVRHVVVPGITDKLIYLKRLADLLKGLKDLIKLELLPYHKLGVHKWRELGLNYQLKGVIPPKSKRMEDIKEIFIEEGITAEIK